MEGAPRKRIVVRRGETPTRSVRLVPALVAVLVVGLAAADSDSVQGERPELLLPGDEHHLTDLPAHPEGTWWVLHRPGHETVLEPLAVVVRSHQACGDQPPEEENGRAVLVPHAHDPVLLLRRHPGLTSGPVHTVFLDDGKVGESDSVTAQWDDGAVLVRHVTEGPYGDEPGHHHVELAVGGRQFRLHAGEWHGDGHWRVRWIGDLNRDGWPDLLLDASYKYSVYTARLFLSREADDQLEIHELATFTHSAC